ncbi:hypothetical protein pb186bvf_014878 [Paramecium bursaria]
MTDQEETRAVSREEGEKKAKEIGANLFYESSALNGEGVEKIFFDTLKLAYENHRVVAQSQQTIRESQHLHTQPDQKEEKKKGCC